jgi:hypothetical protein
MFQRDVIWAMNGAHGAGGLRDSRDLYWPIGARQSQGSPEHPLIVMVAEIDAVGVVAVVAVIVTEPPCGTPPEVL